MAQTMRNIVSLAATTTAVAALSFSLMAGSAVAGPCGERIAELERTMNNATGKEAGTMSGPTAGGIQNKAPAPQQGTPDGAAQATDKGVQGEAVGTTMAGNAPNAMNKPVDPANGRATSPQDVRLQTQGKPTAAQGGNPSQMDDHLGQARASLEQARALDQKNDASCGEALDRAKQLMRRG